MAKQLYASIGGVTGILSVRVTETHSSACSTAIVTCTNHGKEIGDSIAIDMGYEDDHELVFTGYIKQIERQVPEDIWTITAQDVMVRAVDYFVVSSDPNDPYKWHDITAEDLVENVLNLAGLTNYDPQPTDFTFAVSSDVYAEVNLVGAYDYCKFVADLLTWHLWADRDGTVRFRNRKPYVMTGLSGQVGDETDETPIYGDGGSTSIGLLTDTTILGVNHRISEQDLRNRVVVYGKGDVYAEAKSSTSYNPWTGLDETVLPAGYYKTAAAATPILDSTSMAQKSADYNLDLYNKLSHYVTLTVEGNTTWQARRIITLNSDALGITTSRNFYIFHSEHSWDKNGYLTQLELRI